MKAPRSLRTQIVHPGADNLRYEIRQIVEVANAIAATGAPIQWENIGDPVASAIATVRSTASTSPMIGALWPKFLMVRPVPWFSVAKRSCASARIE